MEKLIMRWEYHLPSDTDQLKQYTREVLEKVIQLRIGENINGTLQGRIDPELVREMIKELE